MSKELTILLLKEDNLQLAQDLSEAIPYAKAGLEYRFLKKYNQVIHSKLLKLGLQALHNDFVEDEEDMIQHSI